MRLALRQIQNINPHTDIGEHIFGADVLYLSGHLGGTDVAVLRDEVGNEAGNVGSSLEYGISARSLASNKFVPLKCRSGRWLPGNGTISHSHLRWDQERRPTLGLPIHELRIFSPGAKISTSQPQLESSAFLSAMVDAPTVIASGTLAGEVPDTSMFQLPAATFKHATW